MCEQAKQTSVQTSNQLNIKNYETFFIL
jgi:hypothetical protein